MFERWAETVCGLAPPRASRPSLGPTRLSEIASASERGGGGGSSSTRDRVEPGLVSIKGTSTLFREAAAAAANTKLISLHPATGAKHGAAGSSVGGGGGLYQRAQRSRYWKEGRESSWGTNPDAAVAAPADVHRSQGGRARGASAAPSPGSMLYKDRYQDSWERVLSTVPSVLVNVSRDIGEDSAALQKDLQDMTQALTRQQRGGSEPPLTRMPASESPAPRNAHAGRQGSGAGEA